MNHLCADSSVICYIQFYGKPVGTEISRKTPCFLTVSQINTVLPSTNVAVILY